MRLVTLLVSAMLSMTAVAQEINVVISGKQGGTNYARTMSTAEFLESKGYTVNLIKMFNGKKAFTWFDQSTEPTVMFYTNINWAEVTDKEIPAENVAFIESETYMYACGDVSNDNVVNFSWRSDYGSQLPAFISEFYGKDVVKVPYDSSGAEIEALLAGDTNLGLFNVKNAGKLVAQGVSCSYTTGPEFDANTNSKPFRNESSNSQAKLAMNRFHMIKNIDSPEFVSTLRGILDSESHIKGVQVFADQTMNTEQTAEYINQSTVNWK